MNSRLVILFAKGGPEGIELECEDKRLEEKSGLRVWANKSLG
jgi:hypothetical protein